MRFAPAVIVVLLSAAVALPARQGARLVNSTYAYLDGQKAEPNEQIPATPQANTGNPPNANPTLEPTPANDAALQSRIQQALSNEPTLASSHITVNVTDSAIELSGTATSNQDKQTADRIAQSFDGNRVFRDKLVVAGQRPNTNPNGSKSGASNSSAPPHPQM
jgi:BON domain